MWCGHSPAPYQMKKKVHVRTIKVVHAHYVFNWTTSVNVLYIWVAHAQMYKLVWRRHLSGNDSVVSYRICAVVPHGVERRNSAMWVKPHPSRTLLYYRPWSCRLAAMIGCHSCHFDRRPSRPCRTQAICHCIPTITIHNSVTLEI